MTILELHRTADVAGLIGLEAGGFEGFRRYPDALTMRLIAASAGRLAKPEAELLEDFGAWLARTEPIRRLLRFSGADFADFILTLEELPGRVRMIVPDLEMPRIAVTALGDAYGWSPRMRALLDLFALAGFGFALYLTWQVWRLRRTHKG